MTSRERVLAACAFQPPDRIPRFDNFWEFPEAWSDRFASPDSLTDIVIAAADETILPTQARRLKESGGWFYDRDDWGREQRWRPGAYFRETLGVALPAGTDPDSLAFDSPTLDGRYPALPSSSKDHCVFAKTGGPFLRTTYVRGEEQFLIDIAADPSLAAAIAERVADHITAVGIESLRRWNLYDTGIWIYDDMAYNDGPLFSPASFERVLLPAYRRMVARYRQAGARYVFLHSDGDVRPILDMLVDAGFDGLHPLERRAGMDPFALRERYPKLVLVGGMDNSHLLVDGPVGAIREEAHRLIDLGRGGGYIIGTHSISPEVPLEHFAAYDEACRTDGICTMSEPTARL